MRKIKPQTLERIEKITERTIISVREPKKVFDGLEWRDPASGTAKIWRNNQWVSLT